MKKVIVQGFTFIELAIALAIVAMVVGGISVPATQRISEQQYSDTQARIDKAVDALVGFAILNGRLPCPDIATATTALVPDNRDGIEDVHLNTSNFIDSCNTGVNTTGNNANGMNYTYASTDTSGASWGDLPWQTLGLSPPNHADAWNNRLRYAVFTPLVTQVGSTTVCAYTLNTPYPNNFGLANLGCTPGLNGVNAQLDLRCGNPAYLPTTATTTGNGTFQPSPTCSGTTTTYGYSITPNVAFIVYSMGANGYGSTNINSVNVTKAFPSNPFTTIPDQALNAPELTTGNSNLNMATRRQFVMRERTSAASNAGEYDDVMSIMPSVTLAGKLLNANVWP